MIRAFGILAGGFFAGLLAAWLILGHQEKIRAAEADAKHLASEARGDSLATEADDWRDSAARADSAARFFASRRVIVYRQVLAAPESAAAARGIAVTVDSADRRCIPRPDFAELMAASAAIPLCDSTVKATEARAGAAETAADLFRDAHATARVDAALQAARASLAEGKVRAANRRTLWIAAGSVALGTAAAAWAAQ
jgi:hypothetical protein